MKKALLILTALFLLFLFIPAQVLADTGTYKIDNYTVTLTPQSDGSVNISYYQQWTVLSGNIPWITVGLPNTFYTITASGNNISNIRDDSGSVWDGVYIGLDKTYYANQSFIVSFTVNDKNLLTESTSSWGINFTAGWYDNATIGQMDINLDSPINPSEYTFSPAPTGIFGNTVTWEKTNLPGGYQFNVSFSSSDGSFISAGAIPLQTTNITPINPNNGINVGLIFLFIVIFIVILSVIVSIVRRIKNRAAYTSPEVSPIGNKKYLEAQGSLEDQQKELEENKDKVNEYILSEKDKIPDDEKEKQISDYAAQHNLSLNGDNYVDNYGHSYNSNLLWMFIMMNSMRTSQNFTGLANSSLLGRIYQRPGIVSPPSFYVPPPSCHCACVACACACACACAGGHAAGCTIKLKNIKTGNSND
ncbi:MAG: hypothetical protein ACLPVI_01640 [Dehalococcoidales bacterium]